MSQIHGAAGRDGQADRAEDVPVVGNSQKLVGSRGRVEIGGFFIYEERVRHPPERVNFG